MGGGKYETFGSSEHQEDIEGLLNLGKDYAAMKQASVADMEEIYQNGEHGAGYIMVNGERLKHSLSFADLSRALSMDSLDTDENNSSNGILLTGKFQNPMLYLYRQYFKTAVPEMQRPGEYANEIVMDRLFEAESVAALDAMLVLNAWMYISNLLHQVTTTNCDNMASNLNWQTSDRLKALDRAAALWFGLEVPVDIPANETTVGDEDSLLEWMGFETTTKEIVDDSSRLLSYLAEESSKRLGSTSVNEEILYLFNFVQEHLAHHADGLDSCSEESSPSNYIVRSKVGRLMDLMTVPLIQNLWYYSLLPMLGQDASSDPHRNHGIEYRADEPRVYELSSDFAFLKVYQAALLPRLHACDPNLAEELSIDSLEATLDLQNDESRMEWLGTFQREALSCFRLSCKDVGCDQMQSMLPKTGDDAQVDTLAKMETFSLDGYDATSEGAAMFSRLDRDVRMLDILLESQAYDAGSEIYTYGYHSEYSLRRLAMKEDASNTNIEEDFSKAADLPEHLSQAATFRKYYHRMNMTFPGSEIISVLNRDGVYETASVEEIRAIVIGNIQANILYLTMATSIEQSIHQCGRGDKDLALTFWDQGTAVYFGSIEGRKTLHGEGNATSSAPDSFTSLFGLAKQMSYLFQSSTGSEPDNVQNEMVDLVSRGAELVKLQFCNPLSQLWEEEMLPFIQTTLIRAVLHYSASWMSKEENSTETSQPLAVAYSKGILPSIDVVNRTSAVEIQSMLKEKTDFLSNLDPLPSLGRTIGLVLPKLGIRCEDVGIPTKYPTVELCLGVGPEQRALELFDFSSVETFQNFSAISLDVQEIMQSGTVQEARGIFLHGVHGPLSLASLSRFTIGEETRYDPTLNIFGFASNNLNVLGDGDKTSFDFTNGAVESLLLGEQDLSLIADAAVVCNSWLMIVHKLHQSVNECKQALTPLQSIDEAVALWIGRTDHAMKNGWMLYEIAEQASSYLGLEDSKANQELLEELSLLQADARKCVDDRDTFLEMRKRVNSIIRLSLIPLIQMLFLNMWKDYEPAVRVYSRAILPHVVACNPKSYSNLVDVLYSNFVKAELSEATFDDMAMFLECSRLSCSDLGFLDTSNLGFRYFTEEMCERLEWKSKKNQFVGYIAESAVSEQARLDLDILQVSILTKMGGDEAAEDLYLYGRNSLCEDNLLCTENSTDPVSLHGVANSVEISNMYHTNMLADYYGPSFANNITFEAIRRTGRFSHASWTETSEVVLRHLQVMVSWPAVVVLFQSAIASCFMDARKVSIHQWDSGVALYTGVINAFSGKVESTDGFLLRSLSNSLCSKFHACDETGQSRSNKYLVPLLNKARKELSYSSCQTAKSILDSRIVPLTQISSVQGVLESIRSAAGNSAQSPRKEANIGFVYARSIIPILNASNTTSSNTVEQAFESTHDPKESVGETLRVYEAIGYALPGLGIDCNLVYTTLCALQHNEYALPSYVNGFANIDLDVEEIKFNLLNGNQTTARQIYENGMHSFIGYGGAMDENNTSLKSLGTYTTADFLRDPLHVLFLHFETVVKRSVPVQESSEIAFGDSFVEAMFDMNAPPPVIVECILVSVIWMRVAHSLHMALETCKADAADSISIAYNLDVAAAYWIGKATTKIGSDHPSGNLWYNLTTELRGHFNSLNNPNDSILRILDLAKTEILAEGCESTSLMSAINNIIAEMKIPLVQGLVHSMKTKDRDRVQLYSSIVVPLISACNAADVDYFLQTLVHGGDSDTDADEIIDHLYHVLPCIDLDCSKIGIHKDDVGSASERCSDTLNPSDLGDDFLKVCANPTLFSTSSLNLTSGFFHLQYSRLDLDLREIDIMLQTGSKQAAEDIFFLGKHSNVSLSSAALNSELPPTPNFALYIDYFKSLSYAHDLVLDGFAFMGNGLSKTASRVSILRFSQTMLLGHTAVNTIFEAANKCDTSDSELVEEPWNSAAALLIGSLDRSRDFDSTKWYTLYDLAQNLCYEFDTCSDDGVALVNTELIHALNDGRVAAQRNNCTGLEAAAEEIQALILVPVVQGLLSSAVRLSTPGYTQEDEAEAYVYSRNLLPLIQDIDEEAAKYLETNFALRNEHKFLASTGGSTFNIISENLEKLGLDCNLVGPLEFCEHPATPSDEPSDSSHILSAIGGVLIVFVLAAAVYLVYRLSKKTKFEEPNTDSASIATAAEKKLRGNPAGEDPSTSENTGSDESHGSKSSGHFRGRSSLSIAASHQLQASIIADHLNDEEVPKDLEIKIIEFESPDRLQETEEVIVPDCLNEDKDAPEEPRINVMERETPNRAQAVEENIDADNVDADKQLSEDLENVSEHEAPERPHQTEESIIVDNLAPGPLVSDENTEEDIPRGLESEIIEHEASEGPQEFEGIIISNQSAPIPLVPDKNLHDDDPRGLESEIIEYESSEQPQEAEESIVDDHLASVPLVEVESIDECIREDPEVKSIEHEPSDRMQESVERTATDLLSLPHGTDVAVEGYFPEDIHVGHEASDTILESADKDLPKDLEMNIFELENVV